MQFDCASRTHVGLRRKLNEDAVLESPERGIWAVADGMGGHDAGEVASAMIVDVLSKLEDSGDLARRLDDTVTALQSVNGSLVEAARAGFRHGVIGSTVVGLILENGSFGCFWAGDSRAFRIHSGGITQLTRDHSLVQDLVDSGLIAADEAESHPNANVITRAVGAADELDVDTVDGTVCSDDIFLLASDGLTRLVSDRELLSELSMNEPGAAADKLVDLALERGAPDNVSLVIVRVR